MTVGGRQNRKHHKDRNKETNRISSVTGRKRPRAKKKEIRDKVQATGWIRVVKETGDKKDANLVFCEREVLLPCIVSKNGKVVKPLTLLREWLE